MYYIDIVPGSEQVIGTQLALIMCYVATMLCGQAQLLGSPIPNKNAGSSIL